jgi:hypothetical protein
MKKILYIATVISLVTYLFWDQLPKGSFYIGNALFIFLLCVYIFLKDKKSFIGFFLFCISLNNLIDELFLNNLKLDINELILIIVFPVLWLFKKNKDV